MSYDIVLAPCVRSSSCTILVYAVKQSTGLTHTGHTDREDTPDSSCEQKRKTLYNHIRISRCYASLGQYIYTEREKSFVGITMVFVVLWLFGHLYRAVHGRRGSWMQLQLPFLTLTNSYLALLAHSFWPGQTRDQQQVSYCIISMLSRVL